MNEMEQRMLTPVQWQVGTEYEFPFPAYPFQSDAIEKLADQPISGWFADPGTGKTFMSTVVSLYKYQNAMGKAVIFVIVPPILLREWYNWLTLKVKGTKRVHIYTGSPSDRKQQRADGLEDCQFIIMSMQIFKKERRILEPCFKGLERIGIIDEAHAIKNVQSDNYRFTRDFFEEGHLLLLTGSPTTKPVDAYAYIKLISPHIYRGLTHFERLHVAARDPQYGTVTEWQNLDQLQENLLEGSMRAIKDEVLAHLKKPNFIPIAYDLAPAHLKLYNQLVDDRIIPQLDGGKIDALEANRLYNMSQQMVVNWDHFSGDLSKRAAIYDVLDRIIQDMRLGEDPTNKLIIFSMYKMTNRAILKYMAEFGAVGCYSEVPKAKQIQNIEKFYDDPNCLVLSGHPLSMGVGVNPQHVCFSEIWVEAPTTAPSFHQGVGRVYRSGQERVPNIYLPTAQNTIQVRLHHNLLASDQLINKVQTGGQDLRDAIHGK